MKLRAVRDNGSAAGGTVVVANGEEGEPASIKDRWLLRHRPHLILDGLRLAAAMVGADRTYVYVSDPESARSVEAALAELGPGAFDGIAVAVRSVEPGYVAGEETAAVRALNGGPAKPTDKPPRPFQEGVGGLPTLVSNVETLASLPYLQRPRLSRVPLTGHVAVARQLPGDDHRRRPRARRSTKSRTVCRSPNCLPCTVFRPIRYRVC